MLVVEDGTGKSNANAYDSLANVTAYHQARGNKAWVLLSEIKQESAILYATRELDRNNWRGSPVKGDQALGLPTEDGVDDYGRDITGIPLKVRQALAELALLHTEQPLNATTRSVVSESIGDWSATYKDTATNDRLRFVADLLRGLTMTFHRLESMG